MSCWKCGKNIEGSECEPSCESAWKITTPNWAYIDWDKVKTLEDIIEIFRVVEISVDRNHPKYQLLKRFLKE